MPFSRADGRVVIVLSSLVLLISGLWLIGSKGVQYSWSPPVVSNAQPTAPIWLNLASAEELAKLPGIGPVIAERIISYRLRHGPLRSLDQLLPIQGIGPRTLELIRARVRLDCPPGSC